ncbi:MAG: Rieske (2Fe-2S) protein [Acidobacteria bacterium]|nr:Rieske (2Fe-2S) protein [Acidobacteriota bacterium]
MGKSRENKRKPPREGRTITVGRAEAVPPGRGATVQLKDGSEVALFNVGGRFFAIENFCPHKGYPLADSKLRGTTVECEFHGWKFDVTSGECFTKPQCSIDRYDVTIEDGMIKLHV